MDFDTLFPDDTEKSKEANNKYIPDPFTPCVHSDILHWKDIKKDVLQSRIDKL